MVTPSRSLPGRWSVRVAAFWYSDSFTFASTFLVVDPDELSDQPTVCHTRTGCLETGQRRRWLLPMSPTRGDVEAVILELLGKELEAEPEELREQLAASGAELPIDSLILVEIMVDVEKRFGVRVPEDSATAAALQSVSAFVDLIIALIEETYAETEG
jgi:acyl carrier protein